MTSLFACISDLTLFMRMDPQGLEKHSVSRLSYLFAHLYLLSSYSFSSDLLSSNLPLLSASALLCFSSLHIVGSLTSKLPSITIWLVVDLPRWKIWVRQLGLLLGMVYRITIIPPGWWLTYPSEKWCSSSVGMMIIPNIWKIKKCSKPPTRYGFECENTGSIGITLDRCICD